MATTSRWGLPFPGLDDAPDIPLAFENLATALDDVAMDDQGAESSRPTPGTGVGEARSGSYYYATDTGRLFRSTGSAWIEVGRADGAAQPGDLRATARASAPTGWILCDGAAVSRSTYAALFAAISTTYGAGDGVTTFNAPDLRGRVPVGVDGTAGRLSANDALGQSGGASTHALAGSELPDRVPVLSAGSTWDEADATTGSGSSVVARAVESPGQTATIAGGAGGAHNNMQPYQVVNWLIKA